MAKAHKCDCCGRYFDDLPTLKMTKNNSVHDNCQIKLTLDNACHYIMKDVCPMCMEDHIIEVLFKDEVELYVQEPESKYL